MAVLALSLFLAVTTPYTIPFENVNTISMAYTDIELMINLVFIVDLSLSFFTAFEDESGEMVTSKSRIVKNYLKGWFFLDLVSSIPISLVSLIMGINVESEIKYVELSRLLRLYKMIRLVKLIRIYKSNKFVEKLFSQINLSITLHRTITSLIMMVFMLHLIGCFWSAVGILTKGEYPATWISHINLQDGGNIDKYVASVYWAAVTIYTVGYGDITPQN